MAIYERYNVWNEGQFLFDTTIRGLLFFVKLAFKALIYFPLIFTGYIITTKFLDKQTSGIVWIGTIMFIAYMLYLFVYFLKGVVVVLKFHRNIFWMPLLLIIVFFTCIVPVWLTWDATSKIVSDMDGNITIQWIFAVAFATYIYYQYNFLTNVAPSFAFPAYDTGIRFSAMLLGKIFIIRGARSRQVI